MLENMDDQKAADTTMRLPVISSPRPGLSEVQQLCINRDLHTLIKEVS